MVADHPTPVSSAKRLARSIKTYSDGLYSTFRANRKKFLREMAGKWYGVTFGDIIGGPLNLFHLLASVLVPQLYLDVRPEIMPKGDVSLRPFAKLSSAAARFLVEETRLDRALRQAIVEALAGRGVLWTGLGPTPGFRPGQDEPAGYISDPGRPVTRSVLEDDFIIDGNSQTVDEATYMGHRVRVGYEWAMDTGYVSNRKGLERMHELDKQSAGKNSGMSEAYGAEDRFMDQVELALIWLPRHNAIWTMPGNMDMAEETGTLNEDKFHGPESGPYTLLTFLDMPGSTIPIPPYSVLYELQDTIGFIARNIRDQAEAAKVVMVAAAAGEKWAKSVVSAKHMDVINGDPTLGKLFAFPFPDKTAYDALDYFYSWFNKLSSNPEVTGGLGQKAGTLGQEQMLAGAAAVGIGDKRLMVQDAASDCVKKQMWHLWHSADSDLRIPLALDLGSGVQLPMEWNTEREGDFEDYNFRVQAYNAAGDSPDQRYQRLVQWTKEVLIPLAPLAAATGSAISPDKVAEITGKLLDIAEINDLFQPAVQPQQKIGQPTVNVGGTTVNDYAGRRQAQRGPSDTMRQQGGQMAVPEQPVSV